MIVRKTLDCDACETRVITRTAIGYGNKQTLAFPCPGCGVGIIFTMILDQANGGYEYEKKPNNAHWVETEERAAFEAAFDVEFLVPRADIIYKHDGGHRLSPWMQVQGLFVSYPQFAGSEATRKRWLSDRRPIVERICTHFERRNWDLFTKEVRKIDDAISIESQAQRFEAVTLASRQLIELFTLPHWKLVPRIEQRVALARSISVDLTDKGLFLDLQTSGRLLEWWRQVRAVRSAYFEAYAYHNVILQPLHWKERVDVVNEYAVCNKGFSILKDIYISAFETLARISVIAVGVEAVIHHGELKLPTRKGSLSMLEYEGLANANKAQYTDRFPIADIFHDFLDTRVRNGIGHNSARYEPVDDTVILVKNKGEELQLESIPYTEFCRKVVSIVTRLFVVETYLNTAIASVGGHLEVAQDN